jgi:hypothetical protein
MILIKVNDQNEITVRAFPIEGVIQPHKAIITYLSDNLIRVQAGEHEDIFINWRDTQIGTSAKDFEVDTVAGLLIETATRREISFKSAQAALDQAEQSKQ